MWQPIPCRPLCLAAYHGRARLAALGLDRCDSTGIGKPEPLKFELAGYWSRKITQEHRLVYRAITDRVEYVQARYQYMNRVSEIRQTNGSES